MTLSSFLSPRHTTRGPFPASQAWVWLLDLHWLKRWKWVCHWVQALKSRDWFAILFSRSKVTLVHPPPIPWSDNLTEEIPGADLRQAYGRNCCSHLQNRNNYYLIWQEGSGKEATSSAQVTLLFRGRTKIFPLPVGDLITKVAPPGLSRKTCG